MIVCIHDMSQFLAFGGVHLIANELHVHNAGPDIDLSPTAQCVICCEEGIPMHMGEMCSVHGGHFYCHQCFFDMTDSASQRSDGERSQHLAGDGFARVPRYSNASQQGVNPPFATAERPHARLPPRIVTWSPPSQAP